MGFNVHLMKKSMCSAALNKQMIMLVFMPANTIQNLRM